VWTFQGTALMKSRWTIFFHKERIFINPTSSKNNIGEGYVKLAYLFI
jgi:hypothetical protein